MKNARAKGFLYILISTQILTGCGLVRKHEQEAAQQELRQRWATAGVEAKAIATQCRQQYVSGLLKTHAAEVQCGLDQIPPLLQAVNYPDSDLATLGLAMRLEIAERQDAGKLTAGQAAVEASNVEQDIISKRSARVASRQHDAILAVQAQTQRNLAETADRQSWAMITQQNLAAMNPRNSTTTTTCTPVAGSVTCVQNGP